MRTLRASVVLVVVLVTSVFVGVSPASAHAVVVSGTVSCTDTGQFQIEWTIENEFETPATVAISSNSSGLPALPGTVPAKQNGANGSVTVIQTLPLGSTGSVTLTVSATWADLQEPFVITSSVELPEPCTQPPPEVGDIAVVADSTTTSAGFTG